MIKKNFTFSETQTWSIVNGIFNVVVCGDETPDNLPFSDPCFIIKPTPITPANECFRQISDCLSNPDQHFFNAEIIRATFSLGHNHLLVNSSVEIFDINVFIS
jgi:hypothetical protein